MQGCIVDKVFTLLRSHFLSEAELKRNNNININHSSSPTARFCIYSWKSCPISTVSKTVYSHTLALSANLSCISVTAFCAPSSHIFAWVVYKLLQFWTSLSPSLPRSLSLSLWRWGQRAISRALQTSLGGETLSTVSAGAEQGSPGNKERHKLSSPLHPAVSRTKLFPQSRFRQPVTAFTLSLFSFGAG